MVTITPQLALIRETHRVVLSWTSLAPGAVAAFAARLERRELPDLGQWLANAKADGEWTSAAATLCVSPIGDGGVVLRFAPSGQGLDAAGCRELRLSAAEAERLRAAVATLIPRSRA